MRENHEKEAANSTYRSRKDEVPPPAVVYGLHDERPEEVEGNRRELVFQGREHADDASVVAPVPEGDDRVGGKVDPCRSRARIEHQKTPTPSSPARFDAEVEGEKIPPLPVDSAR
jgi:hypothetical protein